MGADYAGGTGFTSYNRPEPSVVVDSRALRVWGLARGIRGHQRQPSVARRDLWGKCHSGGMSGAWVSRGYGHTDLAHATDAIAERPERLHFLLGERPAVDALRDGEAVETSDLSGRSGYRAWPVFAPPATAAGPVRCARCRCWPVRCGWECSAGTHGHGPCSPSRCVPTWTCARGSGVGVGVGEALVRLRAYAFAHGRPLIEIAHEVLAHRLRFSPNASGRCPTRARN